MDKRKLFFGLTPLELGIRYIGHTKNSVIGNSLILTKPTVETINAGDTLIILLANDYSLDTDQWDNTTYFPTGFTIIKEGGNSIVDCHIATFIRVADGTEGTTITCPARNSTDYAGFYIHIKGANATTPLGGTGSVATTIGTSLNIGSGDSGSAGDFSLFLAAIDGGDGLPFTETTGSDGWALTDEIAEGGSAGVGACFGIKLHTLSASAVNLSASVDDGMVGVQFRLTP